VKCPWRGTIVANNAAEGDEVTEPGTTDRVIGQGQALVRAIESLESIEPSGPIERMMAALLVQAYRRRLRAIVASAPTWVSEQILSASQEIDDQRPAVWLSDN
jgi:hypothetical protein